MMRSILYQLILLSLFPIILHAQDQQKLLEHAYKTHSKKELKQFFDDWHKEIPPVSDSEFVKLDTLQQEAYGVYKTLFQPDNLCLKAYYTNNKHSGKFIILENSIKIRQTDFICLTHQDSDSIVHKYITSIKNDSERNTLLNEEKMGSFLQVVRYTQPFAFFSDKGMIKDSAINFRPRIDYQHKIPVYLTSDYDTLFSGFLEPIFYKKVIGSKTYVMSRNIPWKKKHFIAKITEIAYDGSLYPKVSDITFDDSKTRAMAVFGSYIIFFRKENGIWKKVIEERLYAADGF